MKHIEEPDNSGAPIYGAPTGTRSSATKWLIVAVVAILVAAVIGVVLGQ